jgi:hypothetical protein
MRPACTPAAAQRAPATVRRAPAPAVAPRTPDPQQLAQRQQRYQRSGVAVRAIEPYMEDKLRAAEQTFKELQLRMADPDVAANSGEFQKVRGLQGRGGRG